MFCITPRNGSNVVASHSLRIGSTMCLNQRQSDLATNMASSRYTDELFTDGGGIMKIGESYLCKLLRRFNNIHS